ncbi:helix-turn-helix domain-containing protein [Caldalkalibacillus mannanilyticus]|uniref:helix-turn-helix domain-containing protein n=1 Tax=Caldalkalibacillus mannanilyticus TaxID=1418 RepID=UPI00046934C6|nr:helix-turn-helix domain-containing protein [Caldalkalibacillus mannanilyticus]
MDHSAIQTFHHSLFELLTIELSTIEDNCETHIVSSHILLFVRQGNGKLTIDGIMYSLAQNKCFILHPGMLIEIKKTSKEPIQLYRTEFILINQNELKQTDVEHRKHKNKTLFLKGALHISPISKLKRLIDQLYQSEQEESDYLLRKLKQQMYFYELLYFLHKEKLFSTEEKDTKGRIQLSIEYIHSHFHEEITREKLAYIADLSQGYFSHAFKKEMGLSPIDYLNDVRIKKAKELLITTHDTLREVAHNVGYKDEFYFSRVFKKTIGIAPRVYVNKNRSKIANFVCAFNGHFHVLESELYASINYTEKRGYQFQIDGTYLPFYSYQGTSSIIKATMQLFNNSKPDVIICADENEEEAMLLNKLAPTVTIPWMGNDWRQHLLHIADIVGKTKEANRWLAQYEEKVAQTAQKIKGNVHSYEKIMIVRIYAGHYRLYGTRNIGNVLYNDLKLTPVDAVYRIPPEKNQVLITSSQIAACEADHLFIMTAVDQQSQKMLYALTNNPDWSKIPAVKKRQVHPINQDLWLEYSSFSHEILLEKVVDLLCKNNNSAK